MAVKKKTMAVPVPQSRAEAERLSVELGEAMRAVDRIASEAADQIARIKLAAKNAADADTRHSNALFSALAAYAEKNRLELVGERKSAQLAGGTIGWRTGNPSIQVEDEQLAIGALEARGLGEYLRETIELDKEALLAAPTLVTEIDGISIHQAERLYFKPLDLETEKTKVARAS